jgi:hypothetical protein
MVHLKKRVNISVWVAAAGDDYITLNEPLAPWKRKKRELN